MEEEKVKAKTIMTTRQAAQVLRVGLRHILTLLYEGKLPGAYKLGLQWQIPKDAVEARIKHSARHETRV